jgi:signal transduction histidine kinase
VLVNLVVNALRHSGSPDVRIDAIPAGVATELVVRVIDRGRGIPLEERPQLFEKFRSLRSDPGVDTGLGLPFCRLAVERMGGSIALSSTPGEGTVFAIRLPAQAVIRL